MEKFKLEPGESILRKGAMHHVVGSTMQDIVLTKAGGILTDKRFVLWEKPKVGYPFTPFVWLFVRLIKGQPVMFAVPLARLSAIELDNVGFTLHAPSVSQRVVPDTFFSQRDAWVQAISDAVAAACPGKRAQKSERRVEFTA